MPLPNRLGDGVLDGTDAHARLSGNLADRQIANTMALNLAGDDEENRTLALRTDLIRGGI